MKFGLRVVSMLVVILALVGGIYLVSNKQETRRGATAIVPELLFGTNRNVYGVGETFYFYLAMDTKSAAMKLAAFEIGLKFDKTKLQIEEIVPVWYTWNATSHMYGKESSFFKQLEGDDPYDLIKPSDQLGKTSIDNTGGKLVLGGVSSRSESDLVAGVAQLFRIKFRVVGLGQLVISVDPSLTNTAVISELTNGGTYNVQTVGMTPNFEMIIGGVITGTPTMTPTRIPTPTPTVTGSTCINDGLSCGTTNSCDSCCHGASQNAAGNMVCGAAGALKLPFKTTFAGVQAGAKCVNNWKATVTVLWGASQTRVFENISLIDTQNTTGLMVFEGEIPLGTIEARNNLAIFIKGPRHLQTKYGTDSQESLYNKSGGEINWSAGKVFDFTKFTNLAGDVTGENESPDGRVDGLDFSYVKTEVAKRLEGQNMKADLNGNCQLESQDLSLLMLAMKDKQEQLY